MNNQNNIHMLSGVKIKQEQHSDELIKNDTFPYKKIYTSDDEIYEMFNKLKKYSCKDRLLEKYYNIKNVNIPSNKLIFINKPLLLIVKHEDYFNWENLSDMFQESCRMECKMLGKQSPKEYYYSHIKEVHNYAFKKYGELTPKAIRESIWNLVQECTSHKPTHIMAMIQLFDSKVVLDFCAGWGDRLIGAMAADVEYYCGIDPNYCLHPNYQKIIKFFNKSPEKFVMIESPIETAIIPNREYDLIFTSPPYFDFEIYDNKDNNQSSKFPREHEWFNNFLKVALDKVWKYLKFNGMMCININQKNKDEHYIMWMYEHMKTKNDAKYLGVISYAKPDLGNPQPIWIWKKI
jgi:16S rRNA G966 N2-methylase RsmD